MANKLRTGQLEKAMANKLRKGQLEKAMANKLRKGQLKKAMVNKLRTGQLGVAMAIMAVKRHARTNRGTTNQQPHGGAHIRERARTRGARARIPVIAAAAI